MGGTDPVREDRMREEGGGAAAFGRRHTGRRSEGIRVEREEPAERWRGEGGSALEAGRRRGPVLGQVKGRGGPGPSCPHNLYSRIDW